MARRMLEDGLAAFLRQRMAELSLTGADLARLIGVGQPTVSKWLTGAAVPGVEHLPALAEGLGLDLAEFTRQVAAAKQRGSIPPVASPSPLQRLDALERWQAWAEGVLTDLVASSDACGEPPTGSGGP